MRELCIRADGGRAVLGAVRHCAIHGIGLPRWLGDEYLRRYAIVANGSAKSWDEAFGKPAPPRVRRKEKRWRDVHEAVWAELRADPSLAFGPALFKPAARRLGYLSESMLRTRYYEAIDKEMGGLLNLSAWKAAVVRQRKVEAMTPKRSLPVFALERLNGRDGSLDPS